MLGLSEARVRTFVRERFLTPERGDRGELRFSFQDLVLLRTAKSLTAARIPPTRIRRALRNLRRQLPPDRPLSGVSIAAEGDRIIVRDGGERWNPESGQTLFDFQVRELVDQVAPLSERGRAAPGGPADAEEWYATGFMLEKVDPDRSLAAYRKAVELDPRHTDALINLGCMLQERGEAVQAEQHYRAAAAANGNSGTAWFNLGTLLEDQGRWQDAAIAYSDAIAHDAQCADAYFNLARLCERAGRETDALRLLKSYRQILRQR